MARRHDTTVQREVVDDLPTTSRRRLMGRGALAAVGVVALAETLPRAPMAFPAIGGTTRVALDAVDVTAQVVGKTPGARAEHGDQIITIGDLFVGDLKVGEFYSTSIWLTRGGWNQQQLAATAEQHTFHLDAGTIMGMGTSTHDDQPDDFAVVGGTGRFARVSGTYQAVIRPHRLGGDATGDFLFDLTLEEAR